MVTKALLLVLALLMAGCGAQPRPERRPEGYHPDRFPDIPLPPGYGIDERHDQLATTTGGGLVRRFDVVLVKRPKVEADTGAALLTWCDTTLTGTGWTPTKAPASGSRRYVRSRSGGVGEELTVQVQGVRISYQLRPWTLPAP